MTTPSASRAPAASTADRATSDPAPLVTTRTAAEPPAAEPDHVTAGQIAEFLRYLTELRGDDPGERAAFLARKTELFTRLAADPALPTAPEGRTP